MKGGRQRGATLAELALGFGIFVFFLGALFALFTRGYQAFHFLSGRQGLQGEFLRAKSILQADLGCTHFRSIGLEQRTSLVGSDTVRRDQVCCLTLRDWQDPASYDVELGIPLWNRYAVYQTSLDGPVLTRIAVEPDDALPYRIRPLDGFATIVDEYVTGRTELSSQLRSFACELDRGLQEITVTLVLESAGGKRGLDDNVSKELFEAKVKWTPSNTIPKL